MNREFDVVVGGAGTIGTVAAALLVARGHCAPGRVALIAERLPQAGFDRDWDLRVFALSRASQRLLEACGVWQRIRADRICQYERMCIWDANGAADAAGSLQFDCAEIGEPNLGSIVDGRELQWRCLEAARAAGVVVIEAGIDTAVCGDAEVRVRLSDGRELAGQLLLAADGTDSKIRNLLHIGTAGHAYDQDALVAHVRTSKPHRHTAWQRFLATGPLAFLPLPDGRSSIVWSVARDQAARLRALDASAFAGALDQAGGEVLGRSEIATTVASFPLRLQYAMDYVRPRVALLGDAAHVVHPLAGQGLNLGLLDCAALIEVLGDAEDARAFGDMRLLRRYERRRRSENLLAAAAFDGLDRLFSNADPALSGLRAAGLGLVGRSRFLRRRFAERALGLSGDAPAFLRSRP